MKSATPQDTQDHMLGAGAFTFSWWRKAVITGEDTPDWSATLTIEDGNGGLKTEVINHHLVLAAARKVIQHKPEYASNALVRECLNLVFNGDEADFDAPSSDELLQVMTLGEIVYG